MKHILQFPNIHPCSPSVSPAPVSAQGAGVTCHMWCEPSLETGMDRRIVSVWSKHQIVFWYPLKILSLVYWSSGSWAFEACFTLDICDLSLLWRSSWLLWVCWLLSQLESHLTSTLASSNSWDISRHSNNLWRESYTQSLIEHGQVNISSCGDFISGPVHRTSKSCSTENSHWSRWRIRIYGAVINSIWR